MPGRFRHIGKATSVVPHRSCKIVLDNDPLIQSWGLANFFIAHRSTLHICFENYWSGSVDRWIAPALTMTSKVCLSRQKVFSRFSKFIPRDKTFTPTWSETHETVRHAHFSTLANLRYKIKKSRMKKFCHYPHVSVSHLSQKKLCTNRGVGTDPKSLSLATKSFLSFFKVLSLATKFSPNLEWDCETHETHETRPFFYACILAMQIKKHG